MGIGTSLGAYFDDAFHHQAGINTDPSMDNNTIDPDLDSGAGVKPKPKLDIMPVSDIHTEPTESEMLGAKASDLATAALAKNQGDLGRQATSDADTRVDLPNIEDVPHHDAIEDIGKTLFNAVTLPGDVYQGKVDPSSDEAIHRSFDLATIVGAGGVKVGKGEVPPSYQERFGMSPEEAANAYHNLPQGDGIRFAHHYEENAASHEWPVYEQLVNDDLRQVPFDPRAPHEISPQTYHAEGPSPHEQVIRSLRRQTPVEGENLEQVMRRVHEDSAVPAHESFDELMARLDREDASAAEARVAGAKNFKSYHGVDVADRGYGSFLFKVGDSKPLDLKLHERNGGKELYVGWIGDPSGQAVNNIGGKAMRGLIEMLKDKYPNAETIAGFRVSGARGAAGEPEVARMRIRPAKAGPRRKSIEELNDEWDLSSPTE